MGIVNVTPDSFSDGGQFLAIPSAVERSRKLVEEGADILDIGGESSRPGAAVVDLDEELRRVLPALEAIREAVSVPISVDTTKPEVARRALALGAEIINDIGGLSDPEMMGVIAESNAGAVIMHMAGTPQTMQVNPSYMDVFGEIYRFLARRLELADRLGIARERIAVDPGIGFGKTTAHNQALLRNVEQFAKLGCVVLIGTSRKGFLAKLTGRPDADRVTGSVVSSLAALARGASVVRVHDVGPMADAIKLWEALHGWGSMP